MPTRRSLPDPERDIDRKTSLLRDRPDSARGQASAGTRCQRHRRTTALADHRSTDERHSAGVRELHPACAEHRTRTDLLFTMSDNTRPSHETKVRETLLLLDEPPSSAH
jgi:hypothetical protein